MKEKFKKRKSIVAIVISLILVICCLVGASTMAFPSQVGNPGAKAAKSGKFVEVETGGSQDFTSHHYIFELYDDSIFEKPIEELPIGTQVVINDFVYTLGYYWSKTNAKPTIGELDSDNQYLVKVPDYTGWELQDEDAYGWGVAAIKTDKTEYTPVYAVINEINVTYMTNCFANCTKMTKAPLLPSFVLETTNAFLNCKDLTTVRIPDEGYTTQIMNTIGKNMFKGCENLKNIYIPATITTINCNSAAESPFNGCDSDLTIYLENENKASWGEYWDNLSIVKDAKIVTDTTLMEYCLKTNTLI